MLQRCAVRVIDLRGCAYITDAGVQLGVSIPDDPIRIDGDGDE